MVFVRQLAHFQISSGKMKGLPGIIVKKWNGHILSEGEIYTAISCVKRGRIKDGQLGKVKMLREKKNKIYNEISETKHKMKQKMICKKGECLTQMTK